MDLDLAFLHERMKGRRDRMAEPDAVDLKRPLSVALPLIAAISAGLWLAIWCVFAVVF
jgi:hypothetical protein